MRVPPSSSASVCASSSSSLNATLVAFEPSSASENVIRSLDPARCVITPTLPPPSVTKVCNTPTPGSFTRLTSTILRPSYPYVKTRLVPVLCLVVRGNDDLNPLELLEVGVAGRRHRPAQCADEVDPAVRDR